MAISEKVQNTVNEIREWVNAGNELYPMFLSHTNGRAATSSAIRVALAQNIIEQNGVDGCGKPKYVKRSEVNKSSPWYKN